MPELPEVETSRRGIEPHLVGATILHAVVRNCLLYTSQLFLEYQWDAFTEHIAQNAAKHAGGYRRDNGNNRAVPHIPVSYTHLDVYKRQGRASVINFAEINSVIRKMGCQNLHALAFQMSDGIANGAVRFHLYPARCV